jgi:hypothetical protein
MLNIPEVCRTLEYYLTKGTTMAKKQTAETPVEATEVLEATKDTVKAPAPASVGDVKPGANNDDISYITVATTRPGAKLNVRSSPSVPSAGSPSNIIGELEHGARRQVLDATDGWVKVKEGWVMGEFVK